jgi:hypothetical protein
MNQAPAAQNVNMDLDTLVGIIRQVVREEIARAMTGGSGDQGVVYLEPDSPLYRDMEQILRRKEQGQVKLHTHQEVWSE